MKEISGQITDLPLAEKRALLARLVKAKDNGVNAFPLSYAQQRLWFLAHLEPDVSVYNIASALMLRGPVDLAALERSFNEIIRRHAILRTTFQSVDGRPVQVVFPSVTVSLAVVDLRGLPERATQDEISHLAALEAGHRFNLSRGPLLRLVLVGLSDDEYVLLQTAHHIITDGWSMGILRGEVQALYDAFSRGLPSPLPELKIQYGDFAQWQRRWLQGETLQAHLAYWNRKLADSARVLELPTDHPRPAIQSHRGATQSHVIPESVANSIKALCHQESVTLFMVLLAAFQTLLYRYTGQEDVSVGTVNSGRNRAELQGLIGFFVNTLVMRTDLSGDPTFREVIARVRDVALGAFAHQDVPFEMLVDELQPERDLSRTPLFQVMFLFQNALIAPMSVADSELRYLEGKSGTSKFDLTLAMAEIGQGFLASMEYSTDLYEAATISRLLRNMHILLEGIAAGPDQRILSLPILSEAERDQLLTEWNDTRKDYPSNHTMKTLLENQVSQRPEATAVISRGEALSYAELNERANQIAHHLMRKGIGAESRVGICVDRGIDMVAGLLGILKAGAAYVPLDPEYPRHRLTYMMDDSGVEVVITQSSLLEVIRSEGVDAVCVDREWAEIASQPTINPDVRIEPDNLAYVIYTSGSTGLPKGVAIQHNSASAFLHWAAQEFGQLLGSVLATTSVCFDLSVFEIFAPLSVGGKVVVSQGPLAVTEEEADEVRLINTVPSAIEEMVRGGRIGAGVRGVNLAGEALRRRIVEQVYGESSVEEVRNLYGPSEYTTYATMREEKRGEEGEPLIGRPITNTQVYVLDGEKRPVPVGVAGELYISGAGLARGYINKADQTAERFLPNPYSVEAGARMYRTGDVCRYKESGEIEYIGRADNQVKVRGYRIELGEVEAALMRREGVRQAVVVVREEEQAGKRLVAYVVVEEGSEVMWAELRQELKQELPEYMVPAMYVKLEQMPLTPNGKVDRRALPSPVAGGDEKRKGYVAPRTDAEQTMAEIWQGVLGIERVGVYDNFFELGGDSILSLQIVSRANQAGLSISTKDIFQHQTIAELAAVAGPARSIHAQQGVLEGPVPLMPIQHWFFERDHPERHHFNQSILVELQQRLDPGLMQEVVRHLLARHDALRLRFVCDDLGWRQFYSGMDETLPFTFIDTASLEEEQQKRAIELTASQLQASLNISEGPIIRVGQFDLGEQRPGRLFIVVHHLAIDAVSWRILLEDLATAYGQLSRGEAIDLGPKTTSLQYWSERLSEHAQLDEVKGELSYWSEQKAGENERLPVDFENGINNAGSARSVVAVLSPEDTQALLQEVSSAYRTQVNEVLLTALIEAFGQWTNRRRLLVDLEGHGREELFQEVDLARTVGWFTTIYSLYLDLTAETTIGKALKKVKEQVRSVPSRGLGYGLLRYLNTDTEVRERLETGPDPELSFNYIGQYDQVFSETSPYSIAWEVGGMTQSRAARRRHLIGVSGSIVGGQLYLDLSYSEKQYRRESIERLATNFVHQLARIIQHCRLPDAGGYTPSDFPHSGLSQQQIDDLLGNRRDVEDLYVLSPMQEGMLFHTMYAPDKRTYFTQMSFQIEREVNEEAMERAWQRVTQRHQILRTGVEWEGVERPVQIVYGGVKVRYEREDWRGKGEQEREKELERYLREDREKGFEMREAPLLRVSVIRMEDALYQFTLSQHHMLLDGWSLNLLLKEAFSFYELFLTGQDFYPEPSPPYRRYIEWLEGQDMEKAEAYWRKTMSGFTAPTPLPAERPARDEVGIEESYGIKLIKLSEGLTATLQAGARKHQLTLNTVVQGAWGLLLSRYSDIQDVLFGATVSGRPPELSGVESMIGLFINTLPVRVQVDEQASAVIWLRRLQEQQLEMRQYEYTPLARVQRWSDVRRGTPLFESLLLFENYPIDSGPAVESDRVEVTAFRVFDWTNYPLVLTVGPGRRLLLRCNYDKNRFDDPAIDRMMGHLQTLLEGILADEHRQLKELSLLSEAELTQTLVEWNDTARSYEGRCIHELFEIQAAQTPKVTAVSDGSASLTYAELNRRANQIAHHLQAMRVRQEARVGICLVQSIDLLASLLGTLKAGAAYVPLDPTYPANRLKYMMSDAAVEVVLTQSDLLEMIRVEGVEAVCLDSDWDDIALQPWDDPRCGVGPEDLAYIIYTSGSTGEPKGVQIEHGSVVNFLNSMRERPGLTQRDVMAALTRLSFDIAVVELLLPLTAGGRVELIGGQGASDAEELRQILESREATVIQATPATWRMLIEAGWQGSKEVRVMSGGEALGKDLAERLIQRSGDVWNLYGPTETTIWSTVARVEEKQVTIGRPIANTEVYVLDGSLGPVPVGVAGELYISGAGLARGYVNKPELTAVSFIPNPFSRRAGARMYRTGDVCRYKEGGEIEYVGRADNQVKIRGYRIEPGEIEAVLNRHPLVSDAVAQAWEEDGVYRLAAYVVMAGGQELTSSELRSYLKERLPEYMVPSTFMMVDALPMTLNRKIDRKALPRPGDQRPELTNAYVAPRTQTEHTLADIWAGVLHISKVGVHDNFFELGGDSILSIRIVARANQAGIQLTVRQLFEHQTIAELAAAAIPPQSIESEQLISDGPHSLTPYQRWFFDNSHSDTVHIGQSVLVHLRQKPDPVLMEQVLWRLLARHHALQISFRRNGGGWVQSCGLPNEPLPFICVDLSSLEGQQQRAGIELAAHQLGASLELSGGRLLQVALLDLGQHSPGKMYIASHPLVMDAKSWDIFLEDMQTAYQQLSRGQAIDLGPETMPPGYWSNRLGQSAQYNSPGERLALDDEGDDARRERRSVVVARMGEQERRAIREIVAEAYHTRDEEVMVAGLAVAISDWDQRRALLIDVHQRERERIFQEANLSRTIGPFTGIYPVRATVGEDEAIGDVLKKVKEHMRQTAWSRIQCVLPRYLSEEEESQADRPAGQAAEVCFSYTEDGDRAVKQGELYEAVEWIRQGADCQRRHGCAVAVKGSEGEGLTIEISYSEKQYRRESIERLATNFVHQLARIIQHCRLPEAGGYTPSDFPHSGLSQQQIDDLLGNRRDVEDLYVLSPMQEGMLFHTMYAPDKRTYFTQMSFQIEREVNEEAMERAWQRVTQRHQILRTGVEWEGVERPVQVVYGGVKVRYEREDWRGKGEQEREKGLERYLREDREKGFEMREAPLLRVSVIRMEDALFQFTLTKHHILLDGWSQGLLIQEAFAYYEMFSRGMDIEVEPSPPYRRYIEWLEGQDMEKAEAYWRKTMSRFTAPTPLPMERSSGFDAGSGALQRKERAKGLILSEERTAALRKLAGQNQLTLSTLVQGAWALLLGRYSGQDDIVYGLTVSGRPADIPGVESILGLFINTLAIRVSIPDAMALATLLKELQSRQFEARQYEYSPLEQVQRWSDVPGGTALFQTVVIYNNQADRALASQDAGEKVRDIRDFQATNYPLTLVAQDASQLRLVIGYDRSRFDAATIVRMYGHMSAILEAMIADLQQSVSELDILTREEKRQAVVTWNDTKREIPGDLPIHRLFEAQVERDPKSCAIVFEDSRLSYGELNRRANQLAHRLRSLGVGPEDRVGVCIKRSLEMLIGLLGVLKAGAAYVPIDSEYPADRISFMLDYARVSVLLTQERLREGLSGRGAKIVCLDSEWDNIAGEDDMNLITQPTPDNLAYVIYTSGSTGNPKGVMVEHRSLVSYTEVASEAYAIKPGDRVLQFASISWDTSVEEIYSCITRGATLVLRTESMLDSTRLFLQSCGDWGLTVLNLPTAYWHDLTASLESGDSRLPDTIRLVIIGGERALAERVATWRKYVGDGVRLVNTYGATEATAVTTMCDLAATDKAQNGLREVPIGSAIGNAQAYLLDRYMHLVPVGVPGELYIGGTGVARGYLGRPELAAEKFIPNSFSQEPGARLYRTGDLCRYLPDGQIEYMGRIDHQVKIRGFRIEPGEIEVALARHPEINDVVVVAREDTPGVKLLVAYLVAKHSEAPSVGDLRNFLKERVPDYMVPSAFVVLDSLPLTPNGKVNRRALPSPDATRPQVSDDYLAPRDFTEMELVEVWEELLKVSPIGVRDNFFELGGSSLLAVRVVYEVDQRLGRSLPLPTLFEEPTIEHIASYLRKQGASETWSPLVKIQPRGTKPPFFCVHPIDGVAVWYYDLARRLGPDQPFYGLQAHGVQGEQEILTSVEDMAASYIEAIRSVRPNGPYLLGGWSAGGVIAFEIAQRLRAQGQEVALLALFDTICPHGAGRVTDEDIYKYVANVLVKQAAENLLIPEDEIDGLDFDEQLPFIVRRAAEANVLPPGVDEAHYRAGIEIQAAHTIAIMRYEPKPYPGQITLFRARDDQQPGLGWRTVVGGGLDIRYVSGTHADLVREPHAEELAAGLKDCIEKAVARPGKHVLSGEP